MSLRLLLSYLLIRNTAHALYKNLTPRGDCKANLPNPSLNTALCWQPTLILLIECDPFLCFPLPFLPIHTNTPSNSNPPLVEKLYIQKNPYLILYVIETNLALSLVKKNPKSNPSTKKDAGTLDSRIFLVE